MKIISIKHQNGSSSVATGPKSKDGGFTLTIKQRTDGDIITSVDITGRVLTDGRLTLETSINGQGTFETTTKR